MDSGVGRDAGTEGDRGGAADSRSDEGSGAGGGVIRGEDDVRGGVRRDDVRIRIVGGDHRLSGECGIGRGRKRRGLCRKGDGGESARINSDSGNAARGEGSIGGFKGDDGSLQDLKRSKSGNARGSGDGVSGKRGGDRSGACAVGISGKGDGACVGEVNVSVRVFRTNDGLGGEGGIGVSAQRRTGGEDELRSSGGEDGERSGGGGEATKACGEGESGAGLIGLHAAEGSDARSNRGRSPGGERSGTDGKGNGAGILGGDDVGVRVVERDGRLGPEITSCGVGGGGLGREGER